MVACVAAAFAAELASPRVLGVAFVGTAIALIGTGAAYLGYHASHPLVMVPDGFRGYLEPATPFHEQLAFPCFVTLGFVAAILGTGATFEDARFSARLRRARR